MLETPHGSVTFLFAGMPGLVQLWEADEQAARGALVACDRVVTEAVAHYQGRVFKRIADGFCVVFPSVPPAVASAIDIVRSAPDNLPLRIGIHTGDAEERAGDYYGLALSKVARLRDAANPGQILMTETSASLAGVEPGDGVRLVDLGAHRLRDLQRPERLFCVLPPDVSGDFPQPLTLASVPNNLPQQLTSFVGRVEEMEQLRNLLTGTRLLSIVGGAGCGKTRLALQLAAEVLDEYPEGVWFADLSPVVEEGLVAPTIAKAMGVADDGGAAVMERLIGHLADRRCLLLVDNCEQVVAECASVVNRLLAACANIRVLATSRERLRISGEVSWEARPLSCPDLHRPFGLERLLACEAVQLFEDRARQALAGFTVDQSNAGAVARICSQLDGIPLALELAAASVRVLSVEQVASKIGDWLRPFAGRADEVGAGRETLQAAIEWSHDLLTAEEKVLFRRLAPFSGGWSLEAAEAVCSDWVGGRSTGSVGRLPVVDVLTELVDKSLVVMDVRPDGEARYSMLGTVHHYAWGRLLDCADADACMARFRDWFLAMCESADAEMEGPSQADVLGRLELEYDNIRGALKWSVEPEIRLRMSSSLWRFWFGRGYLSEGRSWLEGALSRTPAAPALLRASALNGLGVLARQQGDFTQALQCHQESLGIRRANGDLVGVAGALMNLGTDERNLGDLNGARERNEEGLAIYREMRNARGVAASLSNLGSIAMEQGDYERAVPLLEESTAIHEKVGNRLGVAIAWHNLGEVFFRLERWSDAERYLLRSIRVWQELGNRSVVANSIGSLATVSAHLGRDERAVELLAASQAARTAVGAPADGMELDQEEEAAAALAARLPSAVYDAAWDRGAAMSVEEAAAFAVG